MLPPPRSIDRPVVIGCPAVIDRPAVAVQTPSQRCDRPLSAALPPSGRPAVKRPPRSGQQRPPSGDRAVAVAPATAAATAAPEPAATVAPAAAAAPAPVPAPVQEVATAAAAPQPVPISHSLVLGASSSDEFGREASGLQAGSIAIDAHRSPFLDKSLNAGIDCFDCPRIVISRCVAESHAEAAARTVTQNSCPDCAIGTGRSPISFITTGDRGGLPLAPIAIAFASSISQNCSYRTARHQTSAL